MVEYEIVERRLARVLVRRCTYLADGVPVPAGLEKQIEELNKDLEFLCEQSALKQQ